MSKGKLLLICALLVSTHVFGQVQFGNTIYENVTRGSDSRGLDISSDGNVIALLNSNDGDPFEVKVYEHVNKEWKQKGATINNFMFHPMEVLISGDGNTVFVNEIVTIGVYKWSGTEWLKVKGPFDEDLLMAIDDFSISRSGERVAAYYDFYGHISPFGLIAIFEWNGSEWDTIGSIIRKDQPFGFGSNKKVELSGDGLTLVDGSEPVHLHFGGKAIAYRFDGMDWVQVGEIIQDSVNRSVGFELSLSYDGSKLISAGHEQIQAWSWDGQEWESLGLPIVGIETFRAIVKLDSSGNFLAIGSKVYSSIGDSFHGRIAIYELDGNEWALTNVSVNGEESGDLFGTHMAFSDNGEVIVGSSDRQWSGGENYVKAYVKSTSTSIPPLNPQLRLSVYPNPASDMARVNAKTGILRIDLIDIQGRQLRQELYINGVDKTREIPIAGLSQGNYWLRVTTDEGVGTIPLVVK